MGSNKPAVHVYLLTYNRPQYFLEALHSVLNQDFEDFLVIVSDNSTNDETEKLVQTISHSKLQYIRRIPSTPSLEHYRKVLSEVSSKYFMLFHDDDIMNPDCLKILSSNLDNFPSVAAVGGNAEIFWNKNSFFKKRFFKPGKNNRVFKDSKDLAKVYLTFDGLAPFPSYMYRKSLINGLILDSNEGGQNADVPFLLKILQRGEIIWEHHSQDSQGLNIKEMMKLLNYVHQHTDIPRKSYASNYFRHKAWAGSLKGEFYETAGKITSKRMKMIYLSIFCFSPFDIFLKLFIWRIRAIINSKKTH